MIDNKTTSDSTAASNSPFNIDKSNNNNNMQNNNNNNMQVTEKNIDTLDKKNKSDTTHPKQPDEPQQNPTQQKQDDIVADQMQEIQSLKTQLQSLQSQISSVTTKSHESLKKMQQEKDRESVKWQGKCRVLEEELRVLEKERVKEVARVRETVEKEKKKEVAALKAQYDKEKKAEALKASDTLKNLQASKQTDSRKAAEELTALQVERQAESLKALEALKQWQKKSERDSAQMKMVVGNLNRVSAENDGLKRTLLKAHSQMELAKREIESLRVKLHGREVYTIHISSFSSFVLSLLSLFLCFSFGGKKN
jgi:chromosome segregation ATPase